MHVLFDETNSLIENDVQDEDFDLGLVRKDNDKMLENEPLTEVNGKGRGQEVDQLGGSLADPDIDRNQCTQSHTSLTDLGTGFRPDPTPVSANSQEKVKSGSMNLFTSQPWKHQSSHLLDQIIFDINTGVQTRSKLKKFCLLYLRIFMKLLQILTGL